MDDFNGQLRAPRVVADDERLTGTYQGGVYVQPGATLTLEGVHQGSLHVETVAAVVIVSRGSHQGSLHVEPGARVVISGRVRS